MSSTASWLLKYDDYAPILSHKKDTTLIPSKLNKQTKLAIIMRPLENRVECLKDCIVPFGEI